MLACAPGEKPGDSRLAGSAQVVQSWIVDLSCSLWLQACSHACCMGGALDQVATCAVGDLADFVPGSGNWRHMRFCPCHAWLALCTLSGCCTPPHCVIVGRLIHLYARSCW